MEREAILEALSHSLPLAADVSLTEIAAQTEFFTGADIKALLYNAQLLAANEVLLKSSTRQTSPPSIGDFDQKSTISERTSIGDKEEDSGIGSNLNSTDSSSSSCASVRTRNSTHRTETRSNRLLKTRDEDRIVEFHHSGEMVKQDVKNPEEVS